MRILATVLIAALSATSVASAALVTNGDFESGSTGWIGFGLGTSPASTASNFAQLGTEGAGSHAARLRITASRNATAYLYQVVPVTAGHQYQLAANVQRTDGPGDWYGVFFINGGANNSGTDQALIASYLPGATASGFPNPNGGANSDTYVTAAGITDKILLCEAEPDNDGTANWPGANSTTSNGTWRSLVQVATTAPRSPVTSQNIGGPTGVEWQTKTASGSFMLIGFFVAGNNAGGTQGENDMYADNFVLTDLTAPEPTTLMFLGLGTAAMLRRRRASAGV